jgi:hypothetical protein
MTELAANDHLSVTTAGEAVIMKVYMILLGLAAKANATGTGDSAANQPPVPADSPLAPSRDEAKG